MARIAARSGPDMVAGDTSGVMVTFDGRAVLASRNRCPNPDLRDFDEMGRLRYWDRLGFSPAPQFWNWYAQGAEVPQYARQNGTGLGISTTTVQAGPLVIGSPLPDPTKRAKIAPPGRQLLEVITQGRVGFAEGWRGVAFAWITGPDPTNPLRRRVTPPGPRKTLHLANGQSIRVYPYQEIPKGATGIAVLVTEEQDSELQAMNAPLFFQRGIDLRRERRSHAHLNGPFQKAAPADNTGANAVNDTFLGARARWPEPSWDFVRGNYDLEQMNTAVSFAFRTASGVSARQQGARIGTGPKKHQRIMFRPRVVPKEWTGWIPIFEGKDGKDYSMGERKPGEVAYLYTNDPERFPPRFRPEPFDSNGEDTTGIPAPDEEMAQPEAIYDALIQPGPKDIRCTWGIVDEEGDQDESAPGPRARVVLDPGQTVRVYRPPTANVGKNPEFVERDSTTDDPLHWRLPTVPGVVTLPEIGRLPILDNSGNTGKDTIARTPPAKHHGDPHAHRWHIKVNPIDLGFGVGAVNVYANVLKKNGALVRTYVKKVLRGAGAAGVAEVGVVSAAELAAETAELDPNAVVAAQGFDEENGEDIEVAIGEVGSGADIEVADIEESDLELEFDGEGQPRDLDVEIRNWNAFPGLTASRKRYDDEGDADEAATVAATTPGEKPASPYLDAGYCKVVKSPKAHERPVALAGIACNMIEYYGPYKTPASDLHGPSGLKLPVKPGSQNVFSVYLWWKGCTVASAPLRMALKDRQGRTIRVLPTMVSFAGSSSTVADRDANNWIRRSAAFVAEPNAAYAEFVGGPVGDGLIRFMGFQYEQDRLSPTEFTNENGTYGEVVSSFDTGIPNAPLDERGLPRMPFDKHGRVKELLRAGIIGRVVPGEGTSLEIDYSCKKRSELDWRPWVFDWRDLTTFEQIRVRAKLKTTDTTRSPEVRELFVDVERFQPVLTREDGSEFDGGIVVVDLSTRRRKRPIQETEYADFADGFRTMGKERDDLVFGLLGFLDSGVEQVMDLVGVDDSVFGVEGMGRRYRARILDVDFEQPDRAVHDAAPGPDGDEHYGPYLHEAKGVKGRITQQALLGGNP